MTGSPTILLNVQTNHLETAVAVSRRYPGRIVIGVTAKDFPDLDEGIALVRRMQDEGVLVSAGLGDGAADQWQRALDLARATSPFHLNQVFPAAALSQRVLADIGARTVVNGLVRPSSTAGAVQLGTGPASSRYTDEPVSAGLAADLLQEVGVTSVKLFPMGGIRQLEQLRAVARETAERGMMIEPTGGLTPENLPAILAACLDAGARRIMPHLYSSVKDPQTQDLDLALVANAMELIERHLEAGG